MVVVVQELSLYQPVVSVFLYIYCSIPEPQNFAIEIVLQFAVQVGAFVLEPLDKVYPVLAPVV